MNVLHLISFVLILQLQNCLGAVAHNYEDLVEASNHGHETGLANKGKRCHEPLHLPLYDHFLGQKLLPSALKRRSPQHNEGPSPLVQMASRFRPDEHEITKPSTETGLSEAQERYYTVGSIGAGPKQQILSKLLNIPHDIHLERLVVLAKNKSKVKPAAVPHPVVIDTAHVFTRNDGKPVELDMELHGVKGEDSEDLNNLTSQLNKELDAAIDTKKTMLGDSHLTPAEIDKIIEHVVDQMKKKTPKTNKETVGSTMDLTKHLTSELDDEALDSFKKKRKKGSKKHGFVDEDDETLGEKSPNLKDDVSEVPVKSEDEDKEDEGLLGAKKGYGHSKGPSKGKYGKGGKGGRYRENEDLDDSELDTDNKDDNPLHFDMTQELTGMEHAQAQHEIDDIVEMDNPSEEEVGLKKPKGYGKGFSKGFGKGHGKGYGKGHGKGKGYFRSNEGNEDQDLEGKQFIEDKEQVGLETPEKIEHADHHHEDQEDAAAKDATLGTFSKFKKKGYGYDDDYDGYGGYDGYDDDYGKGFGKKFGKKLLDLDFGKMKGLKLFKDKDYYRENGGDDGEPHRDERPEVGGEGFQRSQGYDSNPGYQGGQQEVGYGNQQQYGSNPQTNPGQYSGYEKPEQPQYQPQPEVYHGVGPSYAAPASANHYGAEYQEPQGEYQQPQIGYQQPQVEYQQPQQQAEYQQPEPAYQTPTNQGPAYQKPTYQEPQYAAAPLPVKVQPKLYHPQAYQPASKTPQAAYGSSKAYKSVDPEEPMESAEEEALNEEELAPQFNEDVLGLEAPEKHIPEDPNLKATFFENEVKRLRQWITDNGPVHQEKSQPTETSKSNHKSADNSAEKEELVDKFTKVIEKDLTDGKKLTLAEKKSLDRKIAKMVRDNLNDHDDQDAETKSRRKLDKLEELVEEEAETDDNEDDQKLGAKIGDNLDKFKSRFSKTDDEDKDKKGLKGLGLNHLLRNSLDNLKKDLPTRKPFLTATPKPVLDLKHIVEDLKQMPGNLMNRGGKLADLMKPGAQNHNGPKLGLRSGIDESGDEELKHGLDEDADKEEKVLGQGQSKNFRRKLKKPEDLNKEPKKPEQETAKTNDGEGIKGKESVKSTEGKEGKDDETVGCLEDLLDKKKGKDYYPEWEYEPYHHHHDDYDHHDHDDYRSADKNTGKDTPVLTGLDKLLHPKKYSKSEDGERDNEDQHEIKTLPEIIKEIEENLEDKLHLPSLGTLPGMRQTQSHFNNPNKIFNEHGPEPQHIFPGSRPAPKIQVNGEQFVPQNSQNVKPLPEMPPRGLPQPGFQARKIESGPEHFNMPLPNQGPQQHRFDSFPTFQQGPGPQNQQGFVGAPQPLRVQPQPQHHDMTHFGKIVPEHLHDLHLRDVSEQMKKHKMYFIGDGIKLPLHMHRHEDGTFHLSVDLQKLCSKCNHTDCKHNSTKISEDDEPSFLSTNVLGSKQRKQQMNEDEGHEEGQEEAMDIEDVPLMMKTPNFNEDNEDSHESLKKKITKRSVDLPNDSLKYYTDSDSLKAQRTDEKFDYLQPIVAQKIKADVEHKIEAFNKDIKDYYRNEADIKKEKQVGGDNHSELQGFLQKRVGLLTNILGLLSDVTFEDQIFDI